MLNVKQNKTCSRPNELLTALARTWPRENITTELYRLLELWSIAKNNMWTRKTLFQSTHLFFNHDRYVLQIRAVKQNINYSIVMLRQRNLYQHKICRQIFTLLIKITKSLTNK